MLCFQISAPNLPKVFYQSYYCFGTLVKKVFAARCTLKEQPSQKNQIKYFSKLYFLLPKAIVLDNPAETTKLGKGYSKNA